MRIIQSTGALASTFLKSPFEAWSVNQNTKIHRSWDSCCKKHKWLHLSFVINGNPEPLTLSPGITVWEIKSHSYSPRPLSMAQCLVTSSRFMKKTLISLSPGVYLLAHHSQCEHTSPLTDSPSGQGYELGCHLWALLSLLKYPKSCRISTLLSLLLQGKA